MRSVNYALRTAYVTSLNGLTVNGSSVPVYYLSAPETETGQYYITLNAVANVDVSSKSGADTVTSMQVQIHTWGNGSNAGKMADDIADAVLQLIYRTPQSRISITGFDHVSTKLGNDITQELNGIGNRVFVTRILTFDHYLFHYIS